jgi:serine/threonine protein kinase
VRSRTSDLPFEKLPGLEASFDQIQKMAIGGMAEVYRGRQRSLDRAVAIKRIRPELRTNRDIQERFRREARGSGNLLHQNLAHVYDFISVDDELYIIMEYISGFDLAEVLERTQSLPIDVAGFVALKILEGLSFVHSHGMVHRDIKPDNIRLSTRGEVKIMDFGIALDPGDMNLTQPGMLVGSPHYLSPEQISGQKLDYRVDLFSFGITFYEMLTGQKPFAESGQESVYMRIQKGRFIAPQELRPDIPSVYARIIESCLEVQPQRRPRKAESVWQTLHQFLVAHYTFETESRIRQFLLQSAMLPGDPSLIDVGEKTSPGASQKSSSRWRTFSHWIWAAGLLAAFLLGYGLGKWSAPELSGGQAQPSPPVTNKAPVPKKNR